MKIIAAKIKEIIIPLYFIVYIKTATRWLEPQANKS